MKRKNKERGKEQMTEKGTLSSRKEVVCRKWWNNKLLPFSAFIAG